MSTSLNESTSRSKTTVQHANYRTIIASTSVAAGSGSTPARNSTSRRAPSTSSGAPSPVTSQPTSALWECREDGVCDTWSGFLASQSTKGCDRDMRDGSSVKSRPGVQHPHSLTPVASNAAYLQRSSALTALNACIARQNETWEQLRVQSTSERRAEEARRQQELAAAGSAGLENTLAATALHRLLVPCQERWQELLTIRIDEAVAHEAREQQKEKRRTTTLKLVTVNSGSDGDVDATSLPTPATAAPSLPSAKDLYEVLVAGLNDRHTRRYVTEELGVVVDASGIDSVGHITLFEAHIQAIGHWFPNLVPDRKALRSLFWEFDPRRLSCTENKVEALGSSLEVAETQLDVLLRDGGKIEELAAMLRETVHPAMRRLVYPRAFNVPLRVTDGKPLFPAEGEFVVNDTSARTIPTFLTCASQNGRDKVRRRTQHTFSTPVQGVRAEALQKMTKRDALIYVGDSDKYFIYLDDCDVIAAAFVSDRAVPVMTLRPALEQLGRGDNALDAYATYLRSVEGNVIQLKAPPCGFFPIAGVSLLMAPVANMTGDTVEQYDLTSAMFGQLWGRLQGPTPELLQCCLIFERLITDHAFPAALHATRVLQTPPLSLALEWMLTGFAEALDPYEVLLLWDWMAACHVKEMHGRSPLSQPVGLAVTRTTSSLLQPLRARSNSRRASTGSTTTAEVTSVPCALWLLPVLAASLFVFRAPLVLKCRSRLDLEALFVTNHHVTCRSLLQAFLFTDAMTGK